MIALVAWFLTSNTLTNLRRGIQSGFDFLSQPAGFGIGETVIEFDSSNPYWKAFLVGLTNTIRVAIIGILIATVLGTADRYRPPVQQRSVARRMHGVRRDLPQHPGAAAVADVVPAVERAAAAVRRRAESAPGMYLSKGGFAFPVPVWVPGYGLMLAGAIAGVALAWLYRRWARSQFAATGHARPIFWPSLAIIAGAASPRAGSPAARRPRSTCPRKPSST